ncbi:thermonuclease family protein [Bacillus sp. EAC]|uniref:thermonuclease family protein n=1 Tax=Bacillus sp. EAC TaxID=1978338 RepID=UPI000B443B6F|nr:thermonuclease family protein [Bacillus sp. EAC]
MKKLILVTLMALIGITGYFQFTKPVQAKAGTKFTVKLAKCIDGDTAKFTKVGTTRFLYIDTPESTITVEPYGKEASAYTCNLLNKAKTIQLQYDGPKKDKYNRTLAWIWIDGRLIQKDIIKKGYVEKFYDYGTYSYETELRNLQATAQKQKVGLWSKSKPVATKPNTNNKTQNFANCTELRKVYPNGVPKGHKAYQAKMDRDKDNYACER